MPRAKEGQRKRRRNLTEAEEDEICRRYLTGEHLEAMSLDLNIDPSTPTRVAFRRGLPMRHSDKHRKHISEANVRRFLGGDK